MRKLLGFIFGVALSGAANAASWHAFYQNTEDFFFFFDMETVVKRPGLVTLWIKVVKNESNVGSSRVYSYADHITYDCKNRTSQTKVQVQYGKDRNHINTLNLASPAGAVVPGTVEEQLFKIICTPDFSSPKHSGYIKVSDNDIYGLTQRIFAAQNDPAPK